MQNKENRLPEVASFIKTRWESPRLRFAPESISPELRNVAESIAEITGQWNPIEICTASPESLKREKEKFLAAFDSQEEYNPTFDYDVAEKMDLAEPRKKLEELISKVRSFVPTNEQDRLYRIALYSKLRDDLATCDLVEGIQTKDEQKIKDAIGRKYPKSDPTLTAHAEQLYAKLVTPPKEKRTKKDVLLTPAQQQKLKETKFKAPEIKAAFEWVLKKYGILRSEQNPLGFQVVITDRVLSIDVRDKSTDPMTVYIPTTREVTGDKLLELTAHEIEAHARQSVNGVEMFGIGGGALKVDDETLYEGLAIRVEKSIRSRFFGIDGDTDSWYPLAIKKAEEGASFYQIFTDLYDKHLRVEFHIPEGQPLDIDFEKNKAKIDQLRTDAWRRTYRVMRGHTDMSNKLKFANCKDLAYLRGWLMDKQLKEAGYGAMNEMAIMQLGSLQLLARLKINDEDVPHKFQDFTKEYCMTVLLPQLGVA